MLGSWLITTGGGLVLVEPSCSVEPVIISTGGLPPTVLPLISKEPEISELPLALNPASTVSKSWTLTFPSILTSPSKLAEPLTPKLPVWP